MHNIRKNKLYGNWTVLSVRGDEIFKCLEERADWYLSRNLANKISDTPPIIQLNFETKNEGNKGDAYYLAPKKNVCVKCGADDLEILTKHHIVPQMYRKLLPLNVKNRNSFDIVPMCLEHHEEYEREADKLKEELAIKYNAPISGVFSDGDKNLKKAFKAGSAARALLLYNNQVPLQRKEEMIKNISEFLMKENITDDDIKNVALINLEEKNANIKTHAKIVIEQIADFQNFVEMWRLHFLKHVEPKFMPEHWNPHRSIIRD